MFCAIFSISKWQSSWNPKLKKNITTSYKKHSGTKLDQFEPMGLEILSFFSVDAIFSNGPGQPSWIVNLHKYGIVPFRDHCDQI